MHVSICIIYDNSVHLEHLTEYVSFFILFKWCSGCFARVDSEMHIRMFFSSSFKFVNSIINWLEIELGDGFFSSSSLQLIHWWILCVVTIRRELLHCTAPHHFVSIHILLSWLSPPTTFLCGLVCGHANWHGIFGTNYIKKEMNKRMFAALVASDLFFFIEINPVSNPKTHYESHKTQNLSIVPTEKWSACLMISGQSEGLLQ